MQGVGFLYAYKTVWRRGFFPFWLFNYHLAIKDVLITLFCLTIKLYRYSVCSVAYRALLNRGSNSGNLSPLTGKPLTFDAEI